MPFVKLSTILLIIFSFLTPQVMGQVKGEYEQGTLFFKEKQYIKAAPHFLNAWRKNRKNVVALYYSGYCYYAGGDKEKAISAFWQVVDKFPSSKQAQMATRYLRSIDPHFNTRIKKTKSNTSNLTSSDSSTTSNESPKQLVKNLIVVQKPRGKIPAVTGNFVSSIEEMIEQLPLSVLRMLKHKKGRITILPSTVESDYRMQNVRPRGYDSGSTWKNNSAYCRGNNVYISQYRLNSSTGNYDTTDTEVGSVRHEVGHAIDYCLGYVSQKEKFRHAYRLEAAQVPRQHRGRLSYYLQSGRGGPSETFAELCCAKFGGETDEWSKKNCELISKYFKNSKKILEGYLDSIESKYGQ